VRPRVSIRAHGWAINPASGYTGHAIGGTRKILIRQSFSLAHLSDLHVALPARPAAAALLNKRLFGYLAWLVRRRRIYRAEVLAALGVDLRRLRPDHVAITGDLTTLALPEEFAAAAAQLRELGAGHNVSVVPGNHDAYVAVPWQASLAHWDEYMTTDGPGAGDRTITHGGDFPWVRGRSFVGLIGLSSAVPSGLFRAHGELGPAQLRRLESALETLAEAGSFRIVLLHHPPVDGTPGGRRSLHDAAAFRAVIARQGAELILHGHEHRAHEGTITGPEGPVPVLGVPSASALPDPKRQAEGARYHLINIEPRASGWRVTVGARRFDVAAARFVPRGVRRFELRRGHRRRPA